MTQLLEKKILHIKFRNVVDQIISRHYNPFRVVYNNLQGQLIDNFLIVENRLIKEKGDKRESKFEQSSKQNKNSNPLIKLSILKG
ncbi:unnamed protein product [Paramecium sonneborni]|uniref:Uncharacterized protein n=1 Tax=Paramecium sonneborni TaxID=65129 RepID=A0A8S1R286_9CILI|nr:unnamed protein product [Paramecium sonneborni]